MNLKWFVTFIAMNVVSCMKSIQKIPPKYNAKSSNADLTLTLPSDKNSFPDVVYPTSILDIASPFYFNTDNNYEVLEPFSEDVKSSYKLLSSITKPTNERTNERTNEQTKNISQRNLKQQMEINEIVRTQVTDVVTNVSVEENITEDCPNNSKEVCVNSIVLDEVIETENNTDSMLNNTAENYDYYNVSLPREVQNESYSKIPLLVKINIQVFKDHSNKEEKDIEISDHLSSQEIEENTTQLKQVTDTCNDSSEETNSSSEERYTELQDIKHSDFINMLSVLLLDLLVSTDNVTSEMLNTTFIENESLERIVLEAVDNLTNTESFGSTESVLTDMMMNGTYNDFESMVNFTEAIGNIDEKSVKDDKEDYFLDLLVSLDSLCYSNNSVTIADNEYLTNGEYLRSENNTII